MIQPTAFPIATFQECSLEAGVSLKVWKSYSNNLRELYRRRAIAKHVSRQHLNVGPSFWRKAS